MLSQVVTGACLEAQIMHQPVAIASLKPDGWLVHIYTNLKQYGGSISRWTATHSVTHTSITLNMAFSLGQYSMGAHPVTITCRLVVHWKE